MEKKISVANIFHQSPLLCLTAFVKLHLKGGSARTGIDGGLVAAVLIVVRRLHGPGPQHHRLLGLVPAFLIHLTERDMVNNQCLLQSAVEVHQSPRVTVVFAVLYNSAQPEYWFAFSASHSYSYSGTRGCINSIRS